MYRFIIFIIFFFNNLDIISQRKGENWYINLGTGFSSPLYMNNEYSKEMINPFASNVHLSFGRYLDKEKRIGVGLLINSYVFGPNDQKIDDVISRLVSQNGPLEYGDIFVNDFSEWGFGVLFNYNIHLSNKLQFTSSLGGGLMYGPRIQEVFYYNDNDFVYNVNEKGNNGYFIIGDVGIDYILWEKHNLSVGAAYEMLYGELPVSYEIKYGSGDFINIYQSYNYNHLFKVWRHRLKFSIKWNFSLFYGN